MNTATAISIVNAEHDYRTAMQLAGVAYLERHRGEHLSGDAKQLENLHTYLTTSLEVPQFLAGRIAELALGEFETQKLAVLAGFDLAAGTDSTVAWLIDQASRARYPIAKRFLPTHLQHRFTAQH